MRRGATSAALLGVLVLGACGGEGTPEEEVTKSVRTWTAGMSDGDGVLACDRMTPQAERELAVYAREAFSNFTAAADCATNVRRFARRMNPAVQRQTRDADVSTIRIEGAVATVRLEDGGPAQLTMLREGGEWRVDRAFDRGWRLVGAPRFGLPSG